MSNQGNQCFFIHCVKKFFALFVYRIGGNNTKKKKRLYKPNKKTRSFK